MSKGKTVKRMSPSGKRQTHKEAIQPKSPKGVLRSKGKVEHNMDDVIGVEAHQSKKSKK